jgi:hypothetical protein
MAEFSLNLMSPPEITKVYRDRGKMFRMLLLSVGFFGVLSIFFWKEAIAGRIPPLKEDIMGFASAVLLILLAGFFIKMLDSRPALEFSNSGLLARDIAADMIPWSAIRTASIRSYRRSKFVELNIDPQIVRRLRPSLQSRLRFINEALGFHHYYITASILDHDADFLLELINNYCKRRETRVT